jgi:hypothetical protein
MRYRKGGKRILFLRDVIGISPPLNPGNHMALRQRRSRVLNAAAQRKHQENQYDET